MMGRRQATPIADIESYKELYLRYLGLTTQY